MSDPSPDVARINALTGNARSTWFVLLGVLSFVGVTLLSVAHIDFYGVNRATQLPLVNVEIPTPFFFYAAPPLVAAVFGYFHLYLIRLWDALSVADHRQNGRRLGDAITPWLISDAFLYARNYLRQDRCCTHRPLEGTAMVLNFLLAWFFGLFVLFFLWWLSMTARDVWMTGLAGASFGAALLVGSSSFYIAQWRAREPSDGETVYFNQTLPATIVILFGAFIIGYTSYFRTMGPAEDLAPINLAGQAIVERPAGWLPYAIARDEYRDAWCARKGEDSCSGAFADIASFRNDWAQRRAAEVADLQRPGWAASQPKIGVSLQEALLPDAFLVGVDLSFARLQGAFLPKANLEGAKLNQTRLESTTLQGVNFSQADLTGAHLTGADVTSASFEDANLTGTDLEGATMSAANLSRANLYDVQMIRADLNGALLQDAQMFAANLSGATLIQTRLIGNQSDLMRMEGADLSDVNAHGAALKYVDLRFAIWNENTDFRYSFLDGTVAVPPEFRARMGNPCQWLRVPLSDDEFLSVWRWWLKQETPTVSFLPDDVLSGPVPSRQRLAELGLADCNWVETDVTFGPMPTPDVTDTDP